MSESETVMAVCAEWRGCIESADPSVWNDERIAGLVKTTKAQQLAYLDRIDAACKRACNEIDGALCSIEGATGCDIAAVRAALDNTIGECYGSERETLADIVADLRGRADCAERHRRPRDAQ